MFDELDSLFESEFSLKSEDKNKLKLKDGERRNVTVLFADLIGFTSLSEKLDHEQIQIILDKILNYFTLIVKKYDGYVDKYEGDLIMALFGAKKASEFDIERSILCGLDLLLILKKFNKLLSGIKELKKLEINLKLRVGINSGIVTTGKIGAKREGDFTVYGNSVNIASRMESNAPANSIMLPYSVMKQVKNIFNFKDQGEIIVKGKSRPISVFTVVGLTKNPVSKFDLKKTNFVGRGKELDYLLSLYKKIKTTLSKKVVGIKADAGLGKSRIISEFINVNQILPNDFLLGDCSSIIHQPYFLFSTMIKRYFNIFITDSENVAKKKLENGILRLKVFTVNKNEENDLVSNILIIGHVIGLKYKDKKIQQTGETLQRKIMAAFKMIIEILSRKAAKENKPLIIILEDTHWIDDLSNQLIEFLITYSSTEPITSNKMNVEKSSMLFIFLYRPEYKIPKFIKNVGPFKEIELLKLNNDNAMELLASILGNINLPLEIKKQVLEKSEGNPFYLEEWISMLNETGLLKKIGKDNYKLKKRYIPVPNQLSSLILSRIDKLSDEYKLVLQKASIIGREFSEKLLVKIFEQFEDEKNINITHKLLNLKKNDFIFNHFNELNIYLFKHIITHQVVYRTILKTNRKLLHKVAGEIIENEFSDNLDIYYYDLAYHFEKADIQDKTVYFFEKSVKKAEREYDRET